MSRLDKSRDQQQMGGLLQQKKEDETEERKVLLLGTGFLRWYKTVLQLIWVVDEHLEKILKATRFQGDELEIVYVINLYKALETNTASAG